jgi:hypothetical protein
MNRNRVNSGDINKKADATNYHFSEKLGQNKWIWAQRSKLEMNEAYLLYKLTTQKFQRDWRIIISWFFEILIWSGLSENGKILF